MMFDEFIKCCNGDLKGAVIQRKCENRIRIAIEAFVRIFFDRGELNRQSSVVIVH